MIEPISRGVLDPPPDSGGCGDVSRVIASYPVGAKRRRMTGSGKQSIYPRTETWIVSLRSQSLQAGKSVPSEISRAQGCIVII
jgi:hypothetical protein